MSLSEEEIMADEIADDHRKQEEEMAQWDEVPIPKSARRGQQKRVETRYDYRAGDNEQEGIYIR